MTTRGRLHDGRAVRTIDAMRPVRCGRMAREITESFRREQIQETWMKLVKTTVIACALSALLAGPVLAQGLSTETKARTGVQGKSMQGGMSQDEDSTAQPRAAGGKVGMKSSKGTKGA